MNNTISGEKETNPTIINDLIVAAIQDVNGKDIKKFDLRQLEEASADFYIICHANSSTQMSGIIGMIAKRLQEKTSWRANHSEGSKSWMLIDYFSVVIHVFSEEKRRFYNLDGLWNDAIITTY